MLNTIKLVQTLQSCNKIFLAFCINIWKKGLKAKYICNSQTAVTPKGGQDEPRVTFYLTKPRVVRCLTVLLHTAFPFTSASAEKTARSETVLVYNLINLAWLIKCLRTGIIPTVCGNLYRAEAKRMPFLLNTF